MRMHLHYAADLNWRILDDYGCDELKAAYMDKFADKTIFTCFALTDRPAAPAPAVHHGREKTRMALHSERREVAHISHRRGPSSPTSSRRDRPDKKGDHAPLRLLRAHGRQGLRARGHAAYDGLPRRRHAGFKMTDVKLRRSACSARKARTWKLPCTRWPSPACTSPTRTSGMCQRMLEMSLARARDRVTFSKPSTRARPSR